MLGATEMPISSSYPSRHEFLRDPLQSKALYFASKLEDSDFQSALAAQAMMAGLKLTITSEYPS